MSKIGYRPKGWYIKVINVAKTQLAMDEDSYRSNLMQLTGKASLKEMAIPELVTVLSFMQRHGFKLQATNKKAKPMATPQLQKLKQVWVSLAHLNCLRDKSDAAFEAWALTAAKRLLPQPVDSLQWLPRGVVHQLIEQIKQWHRRELLKVVPEMAQRLPSAAYIKEDIGEINWIQTEVLRKLDTVSQADLERAYQSLSKILSLYIGEQK